MPGKGVKEVKEVKEVNEVSPLTLPSPPAARERVRPPPAQ